jgi:energy-coupling factor transporter transmembrane protein EcfT
MILLGLIAWAIILIAVAFWPARVAQRKGYSFIGFFLLSLLFFPFALILAYVTPDRCAQWPERNAEDF